MQDPRGTPSITDEGDLYAAFRQGVWEKALKLAALPPSAPAIPVTKFCASYLSMLNQRTFSDADSISLAVIFSDHGEQEEEAPMVTKKMFESYLRRFGPPERSLTKTRELLQAGSVWFHGKQSRVASERLLEDTKNEGRMIEGLFLMRYSSLDGAFTVDYVKNGVIHHFNNIKNDPQGGVCVFVGKAPDHKAYKFTSMAAFLSKNAHIFVEPCRNPRSHFQWLKLRIPKPADSDSLSGSGLHSAKSADNDGETDQVDMRMSVEDRVKTAIQNAFKRDKAILSLRGVELGPTLPLHICNLTYVVQLDLGNNNLTELPQELASLKSLNTLTVSSNKLRTLPASIFTHLHRLTYLLAEKNALTEIPETVFHGSPALKFLDFSDNHITSLSPAIGGVANLNVLNLSGNSISELPPTIGKLEKLEELKVSRNRLRSLPPQIAGLQSLVLLEVSENMITSVPRPLLDMVVENPRFIFAVVGNPLAREDEEVIRRAANRPARLGAQHEEKSQRHILDGLEISSKMEKLQGSGEEDETTSQRGNRPGPLSASATGERTPAPTGTLWATSFGYFIEAATGPKQVTDLTLQEPLVFYDYHRYFYGQSVHANIIGNDKTLGAICISVQKEPKPMEGRGAAGSLLSSLITSRSPGEAPQQELYYRVLLRTKQKDIRMEISTNDVKVKKGATFARTDDLLNALKRMLKPTFDPKNLYVIRDQRSHKAFADLENRLWSGCSKIGLLYAKDGQTETEMYNNFSGSSGFEDFLDVMGTKIDMMGWTKFRGDFNNKTHQKSVYTQFKDHEVMFHVSTYLPYQEQTDEYGQQILRKRYIGNDIVVMIYYEGNTPIDPSTFVSNFNHVFAIVQPVMVGGQECYRVHMTYKVGVDQSKPRVPEDPTFTKSEIKEWLLTKLINSERCAMSATQFRRPQEMVRHELFKELQEKFPKSARPSNKKGDEQHQVGYFDFSAEQVEKLKRDSGRQ